MEAAASPGAPDIYATVSVLNFVGGGAFVEIYVAVVNATTGAFTLDGSIGGNSAVLSVQPAPLAVSADGSTVFVAVNPYSFGGPYLTTVGTVQTLDTATNTLTGDVSPAGQPITALVPDTNPPLPTNPPAPSQGYWQVASDGGVFSFGDAAFHGSMGGTPLNRPIVGIAAGPADQGYWEVASDGGIFAFGSARFHGSMGGHPLTEPVVGMAATPDRQGYWEVASDGGIFAFGDASFYGSTGSMPLNQPVVGIAATPYGKGYWLVAADGGLFA